MYIENRNENQLHKSSTNSKKRGARKGDKATPNKI